MQFPKLLLLACVLTFTLACNNDDNNGGPIGEDSLGYDGDNVTAPNLPPGTYEAAAFFPASEVTPFSGRAIESIEVFIGDRPDNCVINVYADSGSGRPGSIISGFNATDFINQRNWNRFVLSDPIALSGEAIWIGVQFSHSDLQQTMGCDAGPAQGNGDWLFDSSDSQWESFRQRSGESINWNIRAYISQ